MAPGTRDALVEAAARLLDAGGVEAVTLREVGRRAGVSHNAPYKHFASTQALLAAIAARELVRQGETLAATMQRDHAPRRSCVRRCTATSPGRWSTRRASS
jgi:AcrR family transcriptional regulator